MEKYVCIVCGYVYDPVEGDIENGIPLNTPFVDVPVNWVCPICGASHAHFEKIESKA